MSHLHDREHWRARAKSVTIPASRIWRMFSQPIKNGRILGMRRLRRQAEVVTGTFWGDAFHGVLPESVTALIWRYGLYEKQTTQFILKHLPEGGVFVDIGAHFGYFTMLASRLVGSGGRVVAIEAIPGTFARLQKNIDANGLKNVSSFNLAAADRSTELVFQDFGVVNSSLNSSAAPRGALAGMGASGMSVTIQAEPVDDILISAGITYVDIIKIDAESSEEQVLAGLPNILAFDPSPMVLVELGGGDEKEDERARRIVLSMESAGYSAFGFDGDKLRPILFDGNFPYANLVFARAGSLMEADVGAPLRLGLSRA